MATEKTKTQLIVCGGCNAKMGPSDLHEILNDLPKQKDDKLLVGFDSTDDAAVYELDKTTAIIQTLDFFPSMVSDPYLFGQIAATNALSDVFAMGGDAVLALNIVCFPEDGNSDTLADILRGGQEKIAEAGAVLAGGHSIHDRLPKYGLSVTGRVDPAKVIKNDQVRAGDVLVLTKQLGVGIITTSYGANQVSTAAFDTAIESMTMLNKNASQVMRKYDVSGCTDVTGFGLAGHLSEMLGNDYQAVINAESLPIIPEAYQCAEEFLITAGGQRNRNFLSDDIEFAFDDYALEELVFDPQTSGGLLISLPADQAEKMCAEMNQKNVPNAIIGQVHERHTKNGVKMVVQ